MPLQSAPGCLILDALAMGLFLSTLEIRVNVKDGPTTCPSFTCKIALLKRICLEAHITRLKTY
jgi:hypothetical protein